MNKQSGEERNELIITDHFPPCEYFAKTGHRLKIEHGSGIRSLLEQRETGRAFVDHCDLAEHNTGI